MADPFEFEEVLQKYERNRTNAKTARPSQGRYSRPVRKEQATNRLQDRTGAVHERTINRNKNRIKRSKK